MEHTSGEAEGGRVMHVGAGSRRGVERGVQVRMRFQCSDELERTPSERSARGPALTGRLERAEAGIQPEPYRRRYAVASPEPVRGATEDCFQRAGLFQVVAQKEFEPGSIEHILGDQCFEAKRMRRSANR